MRALVEPSIVYVAIRFSGLVYDNRNRQYVRRQPFSLRSSCSGFFVSPEGHVATAAHCVEIDQGIKDSLRLDAARWAINTDYYTTRNLRPADVAADYGVRGLQRIIVVAYGVSASADTESGTARRATLQGLRSFAQEQGDVALLRMQDVSDVPALRLAEGEARTGQAVWSVGYPAKVDYVTDDTFEPNFNQGVISAKKTRFDLPVYQLDAAMAPGMSGGPTVDIDGNVLGVNSFGADRQTEAFNFVQTVSTLRDLLRDKGIANEIGETNALYRTGVQAYFDGDRGEALANLGDVLSRVPNHTLAREYRTRAEALPKADEGGLPWWAYVLIALAVAGIAGAVAYWLWRRKGAHGGEAAPAPARPAAERGRTVLSPRPGEATLVVSDGPGAGSRFPLSGEVMLGREEADINLDDPEVSRRHALIRRVDGRLEISDLRSANGTRINGAPVEGTHALSHGDRIEVGRTTLTVEMPRGRDSETATRGRPDER